MVEVKTTPGRGGNRHPLSSRSWIIENLGRGAGDYIASLHRRYKVALEVAGELNGRKKAYRKPTYRSFQTLVHRMIREGVVEFTGRQEDSEAPQFAAWPIRPMRRYYRLCS